MKKRDQIYFQIALIFILSGILHSKLYSQEYSISGQVKDIRQGEPIIGANIYVVKEGKNIKGTASNLFGKFKIINIPIGKYQLKVSCVGFKTITRKIEITNANLDLNILNMRQDTINLDAVTIIGKAIPIQQKDDTLEYDPKSYRLQVGADAEDLVKKLQGVTVKDDKIKAQGKEVQKVLVDGKPLFDDNRATLQSVPADMVDKVQVYDKMSDESEFKGYDDGDRSTVIDIKTNAKFKNMKSAQLSAGAGNDDRYAGSASVTITDNGSRYLANGSAANIISASSLSSSDWNFFNSLNSKSNNSSLMASMDGILNSNLTYSGRFGYGGRNFESEDNVFREYYLAAPEYQTFSEKGRDKNSLSSLTAYLDIKYQLDSNHIFKFTPRINYYGSDVDNLSIGKTFSREYLLHSINNSSISKSGRTWSSFDLYYNYKFNKKGRLLNLKFSYGSTDLETDKNSVIERMTSGGSALEDTLMQKMPGNDEEEKFSTSIAYIEPLNNSTVLQISDHYSSSANENELNTFSSGNISDNFSFDSSQSNFYEKRYAYNDLRISLNHNLSNFKIAASISYRRAIQKFNNVYPLNYNLSKGYDNFISKLEVTYSIDKTKNLSLNYMAGEIPISPEKFRPIPDISNPLNISIGNPDLKQNFIHKSMISYSQTSPVNFSSLRIFTRFELSQNDIVTSTILALRDTILPNGIKLIRGARLSKPVNLDGGVGGYLNANYSIPVETIKSNLNFSLDYQITKRVGMLNEITNNTIDQNFGFDFGIKTNLSDDFSFDIHTYNSYTKVSNNLLGSVKHGYFNQYTGAGFLGELFYGIKFTSKLSYYYNGNLAEGVNPNKYYLSCGLYRKLFSQNQGEIRLSFFDILDNDNSVWRTTTNFYYEEKQTNSLGRYFVLAFKYSLRNF